MLEKKFILFLIFVILNNVYARENLSFFFGDKVRIMADKGYRKSVEDTFEAVGNVVITNTDRAIYGEKASMSPVTGDVTIIGNVRYITPGVTVYGSEIEHNIKTNSLKVKNGRILSDNFVVLGKTLAKLDDTTYVGEEAEYTTCKDCPESWSIFGKKVYITIGEYIRIKNAYLKIKGVIVLYIPYLILPIKKNRETGLLFPDLNLNFEEGVSFQQPWFWNISNQNDLTFTPSTFGKRGFGFELQYRHVFSTQKWIEFETLQVFDNVYVPDKYVNEKSTNSTFRHLSDYEHRYDIGDNFRHHFYYNKSSDLDMVGDFDYFSDSRVLGTETGGGGFFEYRNSLVNLSLEGYLNQNLLVANSEMFDKGYVQILPKVNLAVIPFTLLESEVPMFKKITLDLQGDYTTFKQRQKKEELFIRNADRLNANPKIHWFLGNIGPVNIKTVAKLDLQKYYFPYESNRTFTKSGMVYETEFSVEYEKIFGTSFLEEVTKSDIIEVKTKEKKIENPNSVLIGKFPKGFDDYTNKRQIVNRSSYRHSQIFNLKHHFLADQKKDGNEKFEDQINSTNGLFDHIDSYRGKEHEVTGLTIGKSLPTSNTIEFQWNNSIIKKYPKNYNPYIDGRYLSQNFAYAKIAYFNVSQGYDFNNKSTEFKNHLTRLKLSSGFSVLGNSISFEEYYFYNNTHYLDLKFSRQFRSVNFSFNFIYDSTILKPNKYISTKTIFSPIDFLGVTFEYNYDIANSKSLDRNTELLYSPSNNCWKLIVKQTRNSKETKYSMNFLINYNNNTFTSFIE